MSSSSYGGCPICLARGETRDTLYPTTTYHGFAFGRGLMICNTLVPLPGPTELQTSAAFCSHAKSVARPNGATRGSRLLLLSVCKAPARVGRDPYQLGAAQKSEAKMKIRRREWTQTCRALALTISGQNRLGLVDSQT